MLQSTHTDSALPPPTAGASGRPILIAIGIALTALLASCNDDYGDRGICYSCGVTPTEISNGVVAADFTAAGFPDVVALSSILPLRRRTRPISRLIYRRPPACTRRRR